MPGDLDSRRAVGAPPPEDLISRVGWVVGGERHADVFDARGREQWELVKSLLPEGFDLRGRRALDFGCGVGRILRHAAADGSGAELWGSDIDAPSIEWLEANLSPPLHVLVNGERPPLPLPDGHFDLIWSFSVFTHLTDSWSAWLLELHRLLAPDGVLIATVFGPGHVEFNGESIADDVTGMNVMYPGARWEAGGPLVVHSRWWVEAHWGRAFEIAAFAEGDAAGTPPLYGQSAVVMRPRARRPTLEVLEAPEPGEPREHAALRQNVGSLQREAIDLAGRLEVAYGSRSWQLTAPLRAIGERARRRRR